MLGGIPMSPITRAQLLRRALVGGVVITFGELPETLAKLPVGTVAPAAARTAIPTTARIAPFDAVKWKREWEHRIFYGPRESGEWVTDATSGHIQNIELLSVQKADWLDPIEGYPPVTGDEFATAILPPGEGRFFQVGDIVRSSHNGDLRLVTGKQDDWLGVRHIGHTDEDHPLTDARTEAAALAKLLPKPVGHEQEQRYLQHQHYGRRLQAHEMASFEEWRKGQGKDRGYGGKHWSDIK